MERTRPARAEDLDRLVELAAAARAELLPLRGGSLWSRREAPAEPRHDELLAALGDPDARVQLGFFDDYPVGYAVARLERLRTGELLAVVGDIFVEGPFRGVAVGEAVMDAVIEWARARGCVGVDSLVLPGMRDSKNFFERYGMKARALLVHLSFEEPDDAEGERAVSATTGAQAPDSPQPAERPRRPEMAVGGVVVDDESLLMIRRGTAPARGRWSLPGGRVEWGETMAHALVRELYEETGVECVVGELIGWVERITDEHHFVIFDFAATALAFTDPVAGDDALEARWVPLDEVDQLDLVDGLAEFLAAYDIIPTLA